MMEKIQWEELEYPYKPKGPNWYWGVASGTLAVLIISILTRNFLLGILSVIATFTLGVYGAKKPQKTVYSVGGRGIHAGNRLYTYKNLKSFWINYEPPLKKELILESKKSIMPHIKIPLGDVDPGEVRKTLKKYLREEEVEESLMETIGDWLGF